MVEQVGFFSSGFSVLLFFCESSYLFYLNVKFDFYISTIMHVRARNLLRTPKNQFSEERKQN